VTQEDPDSTEDRTRRPGSRGWASLHAVAFVLMIMSVTALIAAVRGFLQSNGLLWVSAGLSTAAIGFSIASVLLPRRG
jgi:hypothetical protein